MKKLYTLFIIAVAVASLSASADDQIVTLDLTKATTPLAFNDSTGAWTNTIPAPGDDFIVNDTITSQCFKFVIGSMPEYASWWGFTASRSADSSRRTDFVTYQYSNMAAGGIVLDADGNVSRDANGRVIVSDTVPYMLSYCADFMAAHPAQVLFTDGKAHEAVGVWVNLSSYPFYTIFEGNAFANPFKENDKFTLTIHGVAEDNTEKTIDVTLAQVADGDLTINRGWKHIDLSALGMVNEIWFSMTTTDKSNGYDNTPTYFCLDKLQVKSSATGVNSIDDAAKTMSYDSNTCQLTLATKAPVMVSNAAGQTMLVDEAASVDLSWLTPGVYLVRSGNATLKIVR